MKNTPLMLALGFALISCNPAEQHQQNKKEQPQQQQALVSKLDPAHYGDFVLKDAYEQRKSGADWLAITISRVNERQVEVKVRSRADKKKPTCTLDRLGQIESPDVVRVRIDDKSALLKFSGQQLQVLPASDDDAGILQYVCSGGGSLAGTYEQVQSLDAATLDARQFVRNFFNAGTGIEMAQEGQKLSVALYGEKRNETLQFPVEGTVYNMESENLPGDGSLAIMVYSKGEKQAVKGFLITPDAQIETIEIPRPENLADAYPNFHGHDEYALVENTLIHRYQQYQDGKANGTMTQVQYKLKTTDGQWRFIKDKVVSYPL